MDVLFFLSSLSLEERNLPNNVSATELINDFLSTGEEVIEEDGAVGVAVVAVVVVAVGGETFCGLEFCFLPLST